MVHGNWLAKWARVEPDKRAMVDLTDGRSHSYTELNQRADRAARMLVDQLNVGPGDRVAVLGENRVEQVELFFAVAKLGAVLVPVNWRLSPDEVAYILADAEPTVLFYGSDVDATAEALAAGLWSGPLVAFDGDGDSDGDGDGDGDSDGDGYADRLERAAAGAMATEGITEDTPLMLLYTSGTTGRPKGAILTHGTITWNAINTATGWDLRADDVTITHTPFFHTGGWNVLTLPLLHRGATVVLAPRFDPEQTLRAVADHGVTVLFAVPTMFQMLADEPGFAEADLSSVRFFISGGAPCPIPLIEAFARRGLVFKQGYGLTEVGPNCFVLHERDAIRKAGAVGFPVLHLDTRLVEWGETEPGDRTTTLDSYIDPGLTGCMAAMRERTGKEKVSLFGHCIGGNLALMVAALHPDKVSRLTTLTTPITTAEGGVVAVWTDKDLFPVDAIVDATGHMPAKLIRHTFMVLKPYYEVMKWKMFLEKLGDEDVMKLFYPVDRWANENVDIPGAVFRKFVDEVFHANRFSKSETHIHGERVNLKNITCPVQNLTANRDWIVPPASAECLSDLVGSDDYNHVSIEGSHVTIMIDPRARPTWTTMSDFLRGE